MDHTNLQAFIGVALNEDSCCEFIVGEICERGSLTKLLMKKSIRMDWPFKHSLIKDIASVRTISTNFSPTFNKFL